MIEGTTEELKVLKKPQKAGKTSSQITSQITDNLNHVETNILVSSGEMIGTIIARGRYLIELCEYQQNGGKIINSNINLNYELIDEKYDSIWEEVEDLFEHVFTACRAAGPRSLFKGL